MKDLIIDQLKCDQCLLCLQVKTNTGGFYYESMINTVHAYPETTGGQNIIDVCPVNAIKDKGYDGINR